jgi:hypothetical protein
MRKRLSALGSRPSGKQEQSPELPTADGRQPTAPDTPTTTNWPLLYSAVLIELAVLVIVFYAFTKAFA